MRDLVLETYGDMCHYAGVDPRCPGLVDLAPHALDPLELAHVVDHEDGGPFELENLRPSHRSCNRRAGRGTTSGGSRNG
jgi:5-methylcytosine-specific restriction endonuclease McrA